MFFKKKRKYFYYTVKFYYDDIPNKFGETSGIFSTYEKHLVPSSVEEFWKSKEKNIRSVLITNQFEISENEFNHYYAEASKFQSK